MPDLFFLEQELVDAKRYNNGDRAESAHDLERLRFEVVLEVRGHRQTREAREPCGNVHE